jgi:hypothetical protein
MFALLRRQGLLGLFADFLRKLQDLDTLGQHPQQLVEKLRHVEGFEQILLLVNGNIDNAGKKVD